MFGREISKFTVIYCVYDRFRPTPVVCAYVVSCVYACMLMCVVTPARLRPCVV